MFWIRFYFLFFLIFVSIVMLFWDWVVGWEYVYNFNREESLINWNLVNMYLFLLFFDYLIFLLGKGEG